jgi:hypothetical protein
VYRLEPTRGSLGSGRVATDIVQMGHIITAYTICFLVRSPALLDDRRQLLQLAL